MTICLHCSQRQRSSSRQWMTSSARTPHYSLARSVRVTHPQPLSFSTETHIVHLFKLSQRLIKISYETETISHIAFNQYITRANATMIFKTTQIKHQNDVYALVILKNHRSHIIYQNKKHDSDDNLTYQIKITCVTTMTSECGGTL